MTHYARGGCHCGDIRYELAATVPVNEWGARYCGCGYCTKHGGLYASHPGAALEVALKTPEASGVYRFATASADFCFCRRCGVLTYLTCEIDGVLFGLVNMNTLDKRIPDLARAPTMSYEGEEPAARLARRKTNWIPNVIVRA